MSSTRGPWMAAGAPSSVVGWPVVGPLGRSICNVSWMPKKAYPDVSDADYAAFNAECEANARLIAEAGTVAHETGLTPRQLAEQRDELLEALRSIEAALRKDSRDKTVCSETVEYHLDGQAMFAAINQARAVIAKAEGGAA